jgi:hypothetical protein
MWGPRAGEFQSETWDVRLGLHLLRVLGLVQEACWTDHLPCKRRQQVGYSVVTTL